MSDEQRLRMCGSCGASVSPVEVTCPSCGALLAAYEAPAGSATANDLASDATSQPVDSPIAPEPLMPSTPDIPDQPQPSMRTPVLPQPERIESPNEPAPFDAAAVLEESRRVLRPAPEPFEAASGEVVPNPAPDAPKQVTPAPQPHAAPDPITPAPETGEKFPPQPEPDTPERRLTASASVPEPKRTPEPTRSVLDDMASRTTPRPAPPRPPSVGVGGGNARQTWEPTKAPAYPTPDPPDTEALRKILTSIPLLLVACVTLSKGGIPSGLLLLLVVAILFYLISVAASFSGRKTTTMSLPKRPDRWHR